MGEDPAPQKEAPAPPGTPVQRAKAGMIFDAADANKDGELTLEELTAYLKSEAGKDAKAVLGEDLSVQDFKTDTRPAMTKAQFQDWYIAKAVQAAYKNAGGYFDWPEEEAKPKPKQL